MQQVIPINKPVGMTPLEAIKLYKQQYPEYASATISYAGRLDPMADGLLLLLVDEENKNRKQYEALEKTYEFRMLLGIETDTYDLLGKVLSLRGTKQSHMIASNSQEIASATLRNDRIIDVLQSLIGKKTQAYPPYSSRTVSGKPLYWWARQNKLHEIQIPEKEIEIYDCKLIRRELISIDDLRSTIHERIGKVHGNFRQDEILQTWQNFFVQYTSIPDNPTKQTFPVLYCQVSCSSGTYVRSIAHLIGEKLGCGALAYSITRTRIGDYLLQDAKNLVV